MAPPQGQFGLSQFLAEARAARSFSPLSVSSENAALSCPLRSLPTGNANGYMGNIIAFRPRPIGFNRGLANHSGIAASYHNPYNQFAVIRNLTLAATYRQRSFTCANGATISADDLRHLLLARAHSPALFTLVAKMYNAYGFPNQLSSTQRNCSYGQLGVSVGSSPGSVNRQMTLGGNSQRASLVHGGSSRQGQARHAPRQRSLPYPKYGPYTCSLCRKEFPTPPHFASHIGSYHDEATTREMEPGREPKRKRVDMNDVEPNEAGINLNLELGLNSAHGGQSSSRKRAAIL
ncbi:hypothetical protein Droror1_Dr00005748 [Drosera rotundifolia]